MSRFTKRLLTVFFILCGVIIAVDPLIERQHSAFVWENWPGFYGAFGFLSYCGLVMFAKLVLRPLVMRPLDSEEEEAS